MKNFRIYITKVKKKKKKIKILKSDVNYCVLSNEEIIVCVEPVKIFSLAFYFPIFVIPMKYKIFDRNIYYKNYILTQKFICIKYIYLEYIKIKCNRFLLIFSINKLDIDAINFIKNHYDLFNP